MLYWLVWGIAHLLARVVYRVSYTGGEHVPRHGPVILCGNHVGWWDPVIMAIACRRKIHFMGKSELFRYLGLSHFFRALGGYPVKRGNPDRRALEHFIRLLGEGKAVGLFPEGTRSYSGQFRRAEPGVGLLLQRSAAPVVPAYIQGPYAFRRPVRLTFGAPVSIPAPSADAGNTSGRRRQAMADEVMLHIAAIGGRGDDYLRVCRGEADEPSGAAAAAVSSRE